MPRISLSLSLGLIFSPLPLLAQDTSRIAVISAFEPEWIALQEDLEGAEETVINGNRFISGTLGWNDVSNNRAYAANELFLTGNGISLYYALKRDANTAALADDTEHALWPSGVAGSTPMRVLILNAMVFKHSRYPNAAKEFIRFMMESEQYDPWLTQSFGYWAQPLRAYAESQVWKTDPKILAYKDTMQDSLWLSYKGPINEQSAGLVADYVMVDMVAAASTGSATPEDAAREAERRARRYYRS